MRIPVIAFILLPLLTVLTDLYIWMDIKKYCRSVHKKFWLQLQGVSSIFFLIYIIVILSLPKRSGESGILVIMWLLYTYLTVYIPKLIYILISAFGRLISRIFRKQGNYCITAGIIAGVVVCCIMWWGALITRKQLEVKRVEVLSDRLPSSFENFTIAQISDIHTGSWGSDTTFVSKLVDTVNSLNPDMIVFTGDIVNRETSEIEPFISVLGRLHAPYGVYSVLGNHDYGDYITWNNSYERERNNELLNNIQKEMGWKMLNNDFEYIISSGDTIALIGVENWGEPPFKQYGDLRKSYGGNLSEDSLYDSRFKILLSHNPEHWKQEVTEISNIDLTLAGHTHAMQMALRIGGWEWSPSKYRYKEWGGMFEKTSKDNRPMKLYVNIGSGEVGMPARLGSAVPEVTLLTLKRKN